MKVHKGLKSQISKCFLNYFQKDNTRLFLTHACSISYSMMRQIQLLSLGNFFSQHNAEVSHSEKDIQIVHNVCGPGATGHIKSYTLALTVYYLTLLPW